VFAWWGRTVYRYRFVVIGVMVALCLGGGMFGMSLDKHVTQAGFYDDGSQSVQALMVADKVYGLDTSSHIVATYTAPPGKTVDDPQFSKKILNNLAAVQNEHPDQILRSVGYFTNPKLLGNLATADKTHAFMSIQLKGTDDDTILNNYKKVEDDFAIPGVDVKVAGLEPVADALIGTIATDLRRMEVLALPLVAVVLFLVFGGVIAAALPVMVGGLCIAGASGIMRFIAMFGPVHYFAQPVVTLIGLGIAIDYGLFIVGRFREEVAEGYDAETAVRRTVVTAGRTVAFSAVIVVASAIGLLLFPQGFVKSLTSAMIASVMLSAILSITVLPACLGILGQHVQGAVTAELEDFPRLSGLAGRSSAEDKDSRRGRGSILGQTRRPSDKAAARVRTPDHHRDDLASHSVGTVVLRRHHREVLAA
jgi:trehalose monomycolate/heme transporter